MAQKAALFGNPGDSAIEVDNLLPLVRALGEVADSKEVNRAFRDLHKRAVGIVADQAAPKAPQGATGGLSKRSNYKARSDRLEAVLRVGGKKVAKRAGSVGRVGAYSGIVHYGTGKGQLGRARPWVWEAFIETWDDVARHYQKELTKIVQRFVGTK